MANEFLDAYKVVKGEKQGQGVMTENRGVILCNDETHECGEAYVAFLDKNGGYRFKFIKIDEKDNFAGDILEAKFDEAGRIESFETQKCTLHTKLDNIKTVFRECSKPVKGAQNFVVKEPVKEGQKGRELNFGFLKNVTDFQKIGSAVEFACRQTSEDLYFEPSADDERGFPSGFRQKYLGSKSCLGVTDKVRGYKSREGEETGIIGGYLDESLRLHGYQGKDYSKEIYECLDRRAEKISDDITVAKWAEERAKGIPEEEMSKPINLDGETTLKLMEEASKKNIGNEFNALVSYAEQNFPDKLPPEVLKEQQGGGAEM